MHKERYNGWIIALTRQNNTTVRCHKLNYFRNYIWLKNWIIGFGTLSVTVNTMFVKCTGNLTEE
jgi:hypothetical protein